MLTTGRKRGNGYGAHCWQIGYISLAVSAVPDAKHAKKKSKWLYGALGAKWLQHPSRLKGPGRLAQGEKGEMAM